MERLLTVKELSVLTEIPARTLRIYADKGLIRSQRNPYNRYRMFLKNEAIEDLKKLGLIRE